jgi:indolepyruvate ferredoxin oxidoreductase, beta subunit
VPRAVLLDSDKLAREAGNVKAANMVLVGAAAKYLPLKAESLEGAIRDLFGRKGEAVVEANLKAFEYGRKANS